MEAKVGRLDGAWAGWRLDGRIFFCLNDDKCETCLKKKQG